MAGVGLGKILENVLKENNVASLTKENFVPLFRKAIAKERDLVSSLSGDAKGIYNHLSSPEAGKFKFDGLLAGGTVGLGAPLFMSNNMTRDSEGHMVEESYLDKVMRTLPAGLVAGATAHKAVGNTLSGVGDHILSGIKKTSAFKGLLPKATSSIKSMAQGNAGIMHSLEEPSMLSNIQSKVKNLFGLGANQAINTPRKKGLIATEKTAGTLENMGLGALGAGALGAANTVGIPLAFKGLVNLYGDKNDPDLTKDNDFLDAMASSGLEATLYRAIPLGGLAGALFDPFVHSMDIVARKTHPMLGFAGAGIGGALAGLATADVVSNYQNKRLKDRGFDVEEMMKQMQLEHPEMFE